MTKIIKEVTLREIKRIQEVNEPVLNLAQMTLRLQSRIIINVSVGVGYSDVHLEYEQPNGKSINIELSEYLDKLIIDTVHRMFAPHNILMPKLIWTIYMP